MDDDDFIVLTFAARGGAKNQADGLHNFAGPDPGAPAGSRASFTADTGVSARDAADAARNPLASVARAFPVVHVAAAAPVDSPETALVEARKAGHSWGLPAVNVQPQDEPGQNRIRICVVDTGLDRGHKAFEPLAMTDADFYGESGGQDKLGHGTECASILFGEDVEGVRIGVAAGICEPLVAKVFGDTGLSDTKAVIGALKWAHQREAQILSLSLSFDFFGRFDTLRAGGMRETEAYSVSLIEYGEAVTQISQIIDLIRRPSGDYPGAIVFAATGNQSRRFGKDTTSVLFGLPAAAPDVIAIGAIDSDDRVATFSNAFTKTRPGLVAPGVGIAAARLGGGLKAVSGTSAACPHAAGVAALMWKRRLDNGENVTAEIVASEMRLNARRLADIDPVLQGLGIVRY